MLLQVIGPYDFKIFSKQKPFINKKVDFEIECNSNLVKEILVLSKNLFCHSKELSG